MQAPGAPGIGTHWSPANKDGVGTAIEDVSRVWFTVGQGIINEVYFPRMDIAMLKDAQCLVRHSDGRFWEEKRDLDHTIDYLDDKAPVFRMTSRERRGAFVIAKEIVTSTTSDVLIVRIGMQVLDGNPEHYRLYWMVAPHIANQSSHQNAQLGMIRGQISMEAWYDNLSLCVATSVPLKSASVGYSGISDGWTMLNNPGDLIEYDQALDGHVVLTGELDWQNTSEQTIAMGFGRTRREARFKTNLTLLESYDGMKQQYIAGWHTYFEGLKMLPDGHPWSSMQRISAMVLKTHHGKLFPGGIIASLTVPWGPVASDEHIGGYHLVWPRDMVETSLALMALGDYEGARQSLKYLMATQHEDGCWSQNFWVDGTPFWKGSQLDETAFPIHLAWRLETEGHVAPDDSVYAMVKRALGYLVAQGPVTGQDRWEEDSGYSPSSLAAMIAALVLGAELARNHQDMGVADYVLIVADYWQHYLDSWTFTHHGTAVPGFTEYYERIHPDTAVAVDGKVHNGYVPIKNRTHLDWFDERAVIDGGFLELVRYGIKSARDPHMVSSVAAYDAALKIEGPFGPLWHRYNGDGYGEGPHGEPYQGSGIGRAWPLLSGERGHYALALGEDVTPYLQVMAKSATAGGMIPEQVWDCPDLPEAGLQFGRPTGSAAPLVWAHSEFIKLVRASEDGIGFETYGPLQQRYLRGQEPYRGILIWRFNHRRRQWQDGDRVVRIVVDAPARIVWTTDGWATQREGEAASNDLGGFFVDVAIDNSDAIEFTFYWMDAAHWEGVNFGITRESQ